MEQNLGSRQTDAGAINDGITFQIKVDGDKYDCLILNEALFRLAELGDRHDSPADIYAHFERTIHGTARRLVHAKVRGNPIVLRANHFRLAEV
jgi:hypothetical protein